MRRYDSNLGYALLGSRSKTPEFYTPLSISRTPLSILLPEFALGWSSIIPQPFNVHVMSPVLGSPISRRLVLTGTAAGVASLLVPVTVLSTQIGRAHV